MAPPAKKAGGQAFPCEAALQPLRNCLVNLPSQLVSVLVERNIVAQNVVVEVTWRVNTPQEPSSPKKDQSQQQSKSVYLGWTGLASKRKTRSLVGRDGLQARTGTKEQDINSLEIDSTFAALVGIAESQKVGVLLHTDIPLAHTVHIEPLTPADWEIIELHATFLETHLLSQIRAVPNPTYKSPTTTSYPLTLHLSPTSTANISVTELKPAPSSTHPFAKISPDAEVIVAPKSRRRAVQSADDDVKSSHSIGAKSGTSTANTKSRRAEQAPSRPPIFLRGASRSSARDWFDDEEEVDKDDGLRVWLDWSHLTSKDLRGVSHVWVSVVRPSGLAEPLEEDPEALKPSTKVVARLCAWEEAPDSRHVVLSSALASTLDTQGSIGDAIRIEAATTQAAKSAVRSLRIVPFAGVGDRQKDGIKIGGRSKSDTLESAQKLLNMYGLGPSGNKLFEGPITDGMLLPASQDGDGSEASWQGGIVKLHPPPGPPIDQAKTTRGWILGSERKLFVNSPTDSPKPSGGSDKRLLLEVMPEVSRPMAASRKWTIGEPLPTSPPVLVGIDSLISQVKSHLIHMSSTLVTGGIGSGKSSLTQLLAHQLQQEAFFDVAYYPCHLLVTDETRISTIKDILGRLFAIAAWKARSGGHSLVILDDIDKLCSVETELEVGGQNDRNRHISELVMSIVREYCTFDTRVVLLATAQNKESVHGTIVGGHVVRETVHLAAPDKEARRKVLESLVAHESSRTASPANGNAFVASPMSPSVASRAARNSTAPTITPDASISFLDLAGRTDGYMPGDLRLLLSRARSEALIRTLSVPYPTNDIRLTQADFLAALKGFVPSSLRNVTLTHSSTTFSSIGGLGETRRTLLETLQYPTLYAPIFANCPLRLRSGLLLYGFPGCGKTLLASAVAGECGLNFISVKGPEILNKYIGASEKSVRDLFERAQAARPCVLFFDEFDSVAPKRGHDSTGVTDRVVNQLLTQMDGAEGLQGVYVLAATSRPDLIDPALLRPGRLDKSLLCDMPDLQDRVEIIKAIAGKLRVEASVLDEEREHGGLRELARRTDGFSGADLQAVVYNAHLEAIHDVLNDRSVSPSSSRNGARRPSAKDSAVAAAATAADGVGESKDVRIPDFSYFTPASASSDAPPISAAQRAADRGRIAQTLVAHQAARQKAKAARRASQGESGADAAGAATVDDDDGGAIKEQGSGSQEPVIAWEHVERALDQTRPSISSEEVRRLRRIYRDFVVGRSGELKDGQGGTEIGGRSSLM